MTLAILALLLGSDNFFMRERAEECLQSLWPLSCPTMMAARDSKDPEVAFRANRVLDSRSAYGSCDTALLIGSFVGLPYSDSMPGLMLWQQLDEARTKLTALGVPCGGPLHWDYRYATKLWLEAGPCDIITLSVMQIRSAFWDANGRYP